MNTFNFKYQDSSSNNCVMQITAETIEQATSNFWHAHGNAKLLEVAYVEPSCEGCKDEECQDCCEHAEHEHYVCSYCGLQLEPSDFYDEDYGSDR